jgi:hypothetical protein
VNPVTILPTVITKHPYDRPGDPEKPSVVKIEGDWFAQVCNADEFPEGYMCRYGETWEKAMAKVPELMAALARRKFGWTEE